jgi:arginase family enzyme
MAFEFLQPIDSEVVDYVTTLSSQTLGRKIVMHTEEEFPQLGKAKIAIFGVLENRGFSAPQVVDLNAIRKELYSLYPGNWQATIVDLGDISQGASQEDTYYAVSKIAEELIKNKVLPLVLGGSQDITYALYRAYDRLEQMVNLVAIDSKFDFGKDEIKNTSDSYLSKIILNEPNNLFNFCNLGYQTYYNSQEEIDLIEKLYFEVYRLGEVSNNITIAEPVMRDADLVSLDLNAIQSSYSGSSYPFIPNGFDGKSICALARYAGISDKVSSFGIFNQNATANEAVLISQIVWYFIEGFNFRSNEYPFTTKENYLKYIVLIEDEELVFFKSNKTDRWWIEIPFILNGNNKLKRNTLLPCMYEDYLKACENEIPERWWKAQRKNVLV